MLSRASSEVYQKLDPPCSSANRIANVPIYPHISTRRFQYTQTFLGRSLRRNPLLAKRLPGTFAQGLLKVLKTCLFIRAINNKEVDVLDVSTGKPKSYVLLIGAIFFPPKNTKKYMHRENEISSVGA